MKVRNERPQAIGHILDEVCGVALWAVPRAEAVQPVTISPDGAMVPKHMPDMPGSYVLATRALARLERGAAGILQVEDRDNPAVFKGCKPAKSAKPMSH